jgi:hypothetical protein
MIDGPAADLFLATMALLFLYIVIGQQLGW